ncbi:o-succinylbenzoate synthase [Aliagarivorans taiwanensis]|uniref:o-succinylbenzoate synthase n=1 Tax=Aliagarivorans taiwanensis TaxID=561966 RepID=UPI00040A70BB|nr:o-succinylbenzoate synthase [Aliagarivorans taiwanensis]
MDALWTQATIYRQQLPFRQTMQFGEHRVALRESLILELALSDGRTGVGEIAPLPGFSQESLEQATQQLYSYLQGSLQQPLFPSVAFGLDCALTGPVPDVALSHDCPLLGIDASRDQRVLQDKQLQLAKFKAARQAPDQDIEQIQALLIANPKLRLRLDANRGWSWEQAVKVLGNIDVERIDYIEEPLQSSELCPMLAERCQIGIALDESLQRASYRYHYFAGLKALVIKPSLVGGWQYISSLISQANQDGVVTTFSSAYESELGLRWIQTLSQRYSPQQTPGLDTLAAFATSDPQREVIAEFSHPVTPR